MKEYEYTFSVKDWTPYVEYCNKQGYTLISNTNQTRMIFRDADNTMGRITIDQSGDSIKKTLDFKENKRTKSILAEREESLPLVFEDETAVRSILAFLGYQEKDKVVRQRMTFEKNNVKFELDHYSIPRDTFVIAIEGEKEQVDKVYQEVTELGSIEELGDRI